MIANWVEGVFSPGAERSGKREDRDTTALSIAKLIQMMAVAVPETLSPPAKACRTSQLTDKKMAAQNSPSADSFGKHRMDGPSSLIPVSGVSEC